MDCCNNDSLRSLADCEAKPTWIPKLKDRSFYPEDRLDLIKKLELVQSGNSDSIELARVLFGSQTRNEISKQLLGLGIDCIFDGDFPIPVRVVDKERTVEHDFGCAITKTIYQISVPLFVFHDFINPHSIFYDDLLIEGLESGATSTGPAGYFYTLVKEFWIQDTPVIF